MCTKIEQYSIKKLVLWALPVWAALLLAISCATAAFAATTYDVTEWTPATGCIVLDDAALQSPVTIKGKYSPSLGAKIELTEGTMIWIKEGFDGGTVILDNLTINLTGLVPTSTLREPLNKSRFSFQQRGVSAKGSFIALPKWEFPVLLPKSR